MLVLFIFQYTGYALDKVLYPFWRRGILSATGLIVAAKLLGILTVFLAVVLGMKLFEKKRLTRAAFAALGLTRKRWFVTFGGGFGIGLLLTGVKLGILILRGEFHILGLYHHVNYHVLVPEWIDLFVLVSLIVVCEEVLFRGLILQSLEPAWGTGFALALSAIAFGSYHGYYLSKDLISEILFPVLHALVGGFLMGGAYIATRALWLPMGIHFGWNIINVLVFGGESTYGVYSVFPHTSQYTVEGDYICLIPTALTAMALIYYSMRLRRWNDPVGRIH